MICPQCKGETRSVVASVKNKEKPEVYRHLVCIECKCKFYTMETVVPYEGEFKKQWRAAKKAIEDRYLARKIMRELRGE